MSRTFLVSELFYPNKTSTSHIMTEIAKTLVKEQDVFVICSKILYDKNVANDGLDPRINLIETSTLNLSKNHIIFRIINATYNSVSITFSIFRNIKNGDKVFAVTNPFLLILILGFLRKIKIFKYILLVHDVFPENTVAAGINEGNSFLYKLLLNIYNRAYKKADCLIVLGNDMKQLIERKGVSERKINIIPNWFDEDISANVMFDKDEYLTYQNSSDKIIIGFGGNLGRLQNLEGFIKIFNKSTNPHLLLVIVGEGAAKEKILKTIVDERVIFLGSKPRNEQNYFLNCFDIGLITLAEGMFGLGVPSKTYNLLALGKPLLYLGDENSEIDIMTKKLNLGHSFNWHGEDELVSYLNRIKKEDFSGYFRQNTSIAMKNYTSEIILEKIRKLIANE